jgi:hypothetical protein
MGSVGKGSRTLVPPSFCALGWWVHTGSHFGWPKAPDAVHSVLGVLVGVQLVGFFGRPICRHLDDIMEPGKSLCSVLYFI